MRTMRAGQIRRERYDVVTRANDEYRNELSNNDGAYFQPTFYIRKYVDDELEWAAIIHDTSCGEFGDRYDAELYTCHQGYWYRTEAHWGSMYDESQRERIPLTWHTEEAVYELSSIGYDIPIEEGDSHVNTTKHIYMVVSDGQQRGFNPETDIPTVDNPNPDRKLYQ